MQNGCGGIRASEPSIEVQARLITDRMSEDMFDVLDDFIRYPGSL